MSFNNSIKDRFSRMECDKATYLTLVVLNKISVWSVESQNNGHPMQMMTNLVQDITEVGSSEWSLFYSSSNNASA